MSRITIVGGGIMGSSIAWHLGRAGIARDVSVIEPDPTYSGRLRLAPSAACAASSAIARTWRCRTTAARSTRALPSG